MLRSAHMNCSGERGRIHITLYTRRGCGLCEEMKDLLTLVSGAYPVDVAEVDIDNHPELRGRFDQEVPVLFIEGRKAFKYRTTESALRRRLDQARARRGSAAPPPPR